jgi:hypothetical protein
MSVTFICGLALGVASTFTVMGRASQRAFADGYAIKVMEQASLGIELKKDRREDVIRRIESNLPGYVLAIQQNEWLRTAPRSQEALLLVKDFYSARSIQPPPEISGILNDIAPK